MDKDTSDAGIGPEDAISLDTEGGSDSRDTPHDGFQALIDAAETSVPGLPHRDVFDTDTLRMEEQCRQSEFASMNRLSYASLNSTLNQEISSDDFSLTSPSEILYSPGVAHRYQDSIDAQTSMHNMPQLANHTNQISTTRDRAILLRYFIQELSPWFDICDPDRHFGQIVPQRARISQTLLNAVCTASARHLVRLQKYRNVDGVLEWNGLLLSHIKQDTALEYQNECVRDLLRFSIDPEQIQNVDLLAASIILRTDEEMDTPCHEDKTDNEVFLRVTGAFMEAQVPLAAAVPHSSPQLHHILTSTDSQTLAAASEQANFIHSSGNEDNTLAIESESKGFQAEGLRQACFWIALRQELHASFMGQRAFTFPLSKFDSFRNFSPANDAVWADRIIILHADVLEYCFTLLPNAGLNRQRWLELKRQANCLELLLPSSFHPIHFRLGDLDHSRQFPEIWYLDNCHVAAAAYTELTKILLATFDPARPKFGNGYLASQREVMTISKSACVKLCGMALSNRQAPPIHLNACVAVMLCGEYFESKTHQDALIWFLRKTEEDIAYPTSNLVAKLAKAWSG